MNLVMIMIIIVSRRRMWIKRCIDCQPRKQTESPLAPEIALFGANYPIRI